MSSFFRPLLHFLFHLGYFGPFLMGVMDSSFLFLPFGNDLLVVALVARHHGGWPFYLVAAAGGSALGVFLLDLVARKGGEAAVQKTAGKRRFDYLKKKIEEHGATALAVGSLAPPPFPFTIVVAITSALGYPRQRLVAIVTATRAIRFAILSLLAIKFGRAILRVMDTEGFRWTMIVFVFLCIVGSVFSILNWIRSSRWHKPVAVTP